MNLYLDVHTYIVNYVFLQQLYYSILPFLFLLTVYIIIITWFARVLLPMLSDVRDVAVISPLSLFLSLFTIYTYYADIMRHRGCLLSSIRRFVFLNLQKKINSYNGTCLMVEHCTWFEKLRINKTALSSLLQPQYQLTVVFRSTRDIFISSYHLPSNSYLLIAYT